jgi:hydrogenase expression/formation protein HypC
MCLAIPGRVIEKSEGTGGLPFGKVRFGSISQEVCLAYTPDVEPGDYVIVHVGFAIQRLDRESAEDMLEILTSGREPARAKDEA